MCIQRPLCRCRRPRRRPYHHATSRSLGTRIHIRRLLGRESITQECRFGPPKPEGLHKSRESPSNSQRQALASLTKHMRHSAGPIRIRPCALVRGQKDVPSILAGFLNWSPAHSKRGRFANRPYGLAFPFFAVITGRARNRDYGLQVLTGGVGLCTIVVLELWQTRLGVERRVPMTHGSGVAEALSE